MGDWTVFTDERVKLFLDSAAIEGPRIFTSLVLLGIGWLIGRRLSLLWSEKQKRREQDLVAARDFHIAYGEFFATWKLWNYFLKQGSEGLPGSSKWTILDRACQAEAKLEATFVRLASERFLTPAEFEKICKFRQLFQLLRESIRNNIGLDWNHPNHPQYAEFKRLAPSVAAIIGSHRLPDERSLQKITASIFEPTPQRLEKHDPQREFKAYAD